MQPCQFTLKSNGQPKKTGDQFTVSMDPPLGVGCNFTVSIDGQQVNPGDRVEPFKTIGFGATGTATFEALTDRPIGAISFTVTCQNCGPTTKTIGFAPDEPQGIPLSPSSDEIFRWLKREREREEHRNERRKDHEEDEREKRRRP